MPHIAFASISLNLDIVKEDEESESFSKEEIVTETVLEELKENCFQPIYYMDVQPMNLKLVNRVY